jgi:signal transduction histidine kinase
MVEEHASTLETERQQIIELAVSSERTRILREMHDVIAHSLAIMIAQADGGSYAAADEQAATRAFNSISDTGRTALSDTRRILGLLRKGESAAELAPMPDEASIETLVKGAQESGLTTSFIRLGIPTPIPSTSGLSLYRICQEALTNVIKHTQPPTSVIVTENWGADDVILTITNSGSALSKTSDGLGQGLVGMNERAALVGGSVEAGPLATGGFRVRAVIPYATVGPWEP